MLKLLKSILFPKKEIILTFVEETQELSKGEQRCLNDRIAEGIY